MTVDLSKYVNKIITVQFDDGLVLTSAVHYYAAGKYHYVIDGSHYTNGGVGWKKPNIIRVISCENSFGGIAQKAPNINLEDFVGQTVMIKTRVDEYFITKLHEGLYLGGNSCRYSKDGYSFMNGNLDIMEIYGEGAYEINTKSTFDNPSDHQIEQAKQLLAQMSEEQITKLLKSLK